MKFFEQIGARRVAADHVAKLLFNFGAEELHLRTLLALAKCC